MALLLRMTEACLLVAMGTFMAVLSQSSLYWQFLNPKYAWLTCASGVILAIIGFACLFHTQRRRKLSELAGILIFLVLAGAAINTFEYDGAPEASHGSLTMEYTPDETPTLTEGGKEYLKINVAELLGGENGEYVTTGQAYAIQGSVIRLPELDKAGYICVARLLITCCFADSTAVVSLVKVDDPEHFVAGSWVRALGTLEEGSPFAGKTITLTGALTAARSERYFLRATDVTEHPVQGVPFIFDIRGEPPFAY